MGSRRRYLREGGGGGEESCTVPEKRCRRIIMRNLRVSLAKIRTYVRRGEVAKSLQGEKGGERGEIMRSSLALNIFPGEGGKEGERGREEGGGGGG